jgi:hypothetical protein
LSFDLKLTACRNWLAYITLQLRHRDSLRRQQGQKQEAAHTKTAYRLQHAANEFRVAGLGTHEELSVRLRYPVERTGSSSAGATTSPVTEQLQPFSEADPQPIKAIAKLCPRFWVVHIEMP